MLLRKRADHLKQKLFGFFRAGGVIVYYRTYRPLAISVWWYMYTLRKSFPKFVFVFTLALSVNNLFEERGKTNAEFIFFLFPHKVTWALPYISWSHHFESFTVATMINRYRLSVSQITTSMFRWSLPESHLFSFMTYHRVCNKSTSGTGTAFHSMHMSSSSDFMGFVLINL